jgi:hypothetical protein
MFITIYAAMNTLQQDCRSSIMEVFSEGETHIGQVCEEVLDICLAKGSRDNMSAVIVAFDALKIGKGEVCCTRVTLPCIISSSQQFCMRYIACIPVLL